MSTPVALIVAALFAVLAAAWAYGWREERVAGRLGGPALLRALALFLLAGGLFLPAAGGGEPPPSRRVALLDVSRSMGLAAEPGSPATRLDSAVAALRRSPPDRLLAFGASPRALSPDSAPSLSAADEHSRLAPALEAARLAGADSVWVLTDGELDDRDEARRTAERLGLGVREERVGAPVGRLGIAALRAPSSLTGGDTARVRVDVASGGELGQPSDSVQVTLHLDGALAAAVRVPIPAPGRLAAAELRFVPVAGPAARWQRLEVRIPENADPLGVAAHRSVWVEVSPESSGAVAISLKPDWELRFLLPVLRRTVRGGARAFVRVADDRYLEVGDRPRGVDRQAIVRAIAASRLLVLHSGVELPAWLRSAWERHPRRFGIFSGRGAVPGIPLRLSRPLSGDWYATAPLPRGPVGQLIDEDALPALPPLAALYAIQGSWEWTALLGGRRAGEDPHPLAVAGRADGDRWVVAPGAGYWKWASRAGASRRVYDGLMGGLLGWLAEDVALRPLTLAEPPAVGRSLLWRIAPDVSRLELIVRDAEGDTVWSAGPEEVGESIADPGAVAGGPGRALLGPPLAAGEYQVVARGARADESFELERPLRVENRDREWLPRPPAASLATLATPAPRVPRARRGRRPVWPFLTAALLLCGEWIWRRRIGLR